MKRGEKEKSLSASEEDWLISLGSAAKMPMRVSPNSYTCATPSPPRTLTLFPGGPEGPGSPVGPGEP